MKPDDDKSSALKPPGFPDGDACPVEQSSALQQKIKTINQAGSELVRLGDDPTKLDLDARLKLLEDTIIGYSRQLLNFDHFAIRVLNPKSNQLEIVASAGLPPEALQVKLLALPENNGISGYVASKGESVICQDTARDRRYVPGMDNARSSLTVPLRLHDRIVGIYNIESDRVDAFDENDKQFAEIFGTYIAIALHMLDLLVKERQQAHRKVTEDVSSELAGPVNDIQTDVEALLQEYADDPVLSQRAKRLMENVTHVRHVLRQAADGEQRILGLRDHQFEQCAVIRGKRILVADDEVNIRTTVRDFLRQYGAIITTCVTGEEAIAMLQTGEFDLVLSDIRLPGCNGYDVFIAAKKHQASVKVILMTGFGYDPNHSIMRASQEGLSSVLFKPFRVEQLLTEIRKALN